MAFLPTLLWSVSIFLIIPQHFVHSFRLNVPRVLLPYHPEIQVQFLLEVTYPEGGCFTWRSSSTDVVSVEVFHPKNSGCSDKAIITSRSRHAYQQSAVIFAEDLSSSVLLSCDVTVDNIQSISITTTTKVLFVDAAPALLIIEAFNKEGDRFSTLGTIPFNWSFNYNEGRPLHIVPFSQSKYEAPLSIEKLEQNQKKGYVVLVEGVSTGSAQLSAKFQEPYLSTIDASTIDLFVLANVMLIPSSDLYLPVYSTVKYDAVILRKGRTEPINLPSNQYQLHLSNTTICDLDSVKSLVTAKSIGSTEILLIDTYMKPKADIKPRSAYIYVVEPDTIQFTIDKGNNWYLQLNAEYEISVKLTDQLGNSIYIPDNAVFKTVIAETYFTILEKSKNGTHFRVKTKKTGKLSIKSSFTSLLDANNKPIKVKTIVTGEQKLEILTPIMILPETLIFPYHLHHRYQYQMKAVGGSGTYSWTSDEPSIAEIEESTGIVTSGNIGEVVITAKDAFNALNRGTAKVFITEPYELHFGESPVEAEIGTRLTLSLKLLGQTTNGLMPFTDCRHAEFNYYVNDPNVFAVDNGIPPVVPEEEGCTTVTLRALSPGDTKLFVTFNKYSVAIDISAYSPLKINVYSELLLTLGAGISVSFEGGPRPWVLDNSKYLTSLSVGKSDVAYLSSGSGNTFEVFCRNRVDDEFVTLSVTNRKTLENPIPAVAFAKVRLCCANPSTLALSAQHSPRSSLPVCPAFSHSIYFNAPVTLELKAQGHCVSDVDPEDRAFDSINSLSIEYKTNKDMIKVEPSPIDINDGNKLYSVATPNGISGSVEIEAIVAHFYELGSKTPQQKIDFPNAEFHASLSLKLVDFARANPPSLVLWNDKSVKGVVKITGGSGHFWVDSEESIRQFSTTLHGLGKDSNPELEVIPKNSGQSRLTLYDLCIEGSKLDIDVKVTDISGINIDSSSFVSTGSEIGLKVAVLDIEGNPFSHDDLDNMHISLSAESAIPELVLKNLATKQVVRFPINLRLVSEIAQEKSASIVSISPGAQQSTVFVSETAEPVTNFQMPASLNAIRELFAAFFEGYHSFVLSTFVLLVSVLILSAAYRYGFLYPLIGTSPTQKAGAPKPSPIQQIHPFGFRGKDFSDRPMFHSTPGNASGIEGITPRITSPQRRSLLEDHPSANFSRRSAGSDDDPYLWTTNDASRMHNSSLINRHYN